jgi:hypothetical protein
VPAPNVNHTYVVQARPEDVQARLLAVGGSYGYKLLDETYGGFGMRRKRVPVWAIVLAVVFFPFGLVFLLARTDEVITVMLDRVPDGTRVVIHGRASRSVQRALEGVMGEWRVGGAPSARWPTAAMPPAPPPGTGTPPPPPPPPPSGTASPVPAPAAPVRATASAAPEPASPAPTPASPDPEPAPIGEAAEQAAAGGTPPPTPAPPLPTVAPTPLGPPATPLGGPPGGLPPMPLGPIGGPPGGIAPPPAAPPGGLGPLDLPDIPPLQSPSADGPTD